MNWRVSSSVDQITCFTPAALAASAMFFACAFPSRRRSAPRSWSRRRRRARRRTPSSGSRRRRGRPARLRRRLAASAFALSLLGSRVIARRRSRRSGRPGSRGTRPPPCEPVEPTTAMIFLSAMLSLPSVDVSPSELDRCTARLSSSLRTIAAPSASALELHLGHHARQRLHAAVAAERDLLGRDVLRAPCGCGRRSCAGGLDRVGADVEHADLDALIRPAGSSGTPCRPCRGWRSRGRTRRCRRCRRSTAAPSGSPRGSWR